MAFYSTPIVANASVEIYRSNRAALPRNTLSEATKLKNPSAISTGAYASSGLTQLRKHHSGVAYNAVFLEGVKGSTLQTDLQAALNPILRPSKLVFSLKVSLYLSFGLTNCGSMMERTSFCLLGLPPFQSKMSKTPCIA